MEKEKKKDKDLSTHFVVVVFTNMSLMTNTATFNTSSENTINCGKIKYNFKTKQKSITA